MQKKHKKIEGQFDSTIPPSAYIAIMVLCTPSLHKCSIEVSFVCWYMNIWKKNMQWLAVVAGTFYQEMWSNRDNHRYCNNRTKMAVCTVVVSNFFFSGEQFETLSEKKKSITHTWEGICTSNNSVFPEAAAKCAIVRPWESSAGSKVP